MDFIYFQLKYIAKSFGLDTFEQPIRFYSEEPELISVELRAISEGELKAVYKNCDIMCVGTLRQKPTRNIRQWINNPNSQYPPGLKDVAIKAQSSLSLSSKRALKCIRWRLGSLSEHNPIKYFHSFMWSIDGELWHSVPDSIQVRIIASPAMEQKNDVNIASAMKLWRENINEPLGHELFQEAWSQIDINPRSALIIGIAAAETGLKELISSLNPISGWIVDHIQSPPLVQMLKELLPELTTKKISHNVLPPPDWLIETLRKGIFLRNKITHGKDLPINPNDLRDILEGVNDLLYFFDTIMGHEWAYRLMSYRMQVYLAGKS